jgi:tetratricopeptide (TPR) repeat protein
MRSFNSIALALLITFASLTFTSCDKSGAKYDKNITEADAFFEKENYNDALRLYKAAAKIKPDEKYPDVRINEINEIKRLDAERVAEENYYREIEQGDDFYDSEEFESALAAYQRAVYFKSEQYPKDRIAEIELLLSDTEEVIENNDYRYHIIVGSFEVESNAEKMQQKLKDAGFNSRLVSRYDGEYTAVTLSSYSTIHDAYNDLTDAKAHSEHPWVIYKKF